MYMWGRKIFSFGGGGARCGLVWVCGVGTQVVRDAEFLITNVQTLLYYMK